MYTYRHADAIDFDKDHIFQWCPHGSSDHILRVYRIHARSAASTAREFVLAPHYEALLVMAGPKRMAQVALIPAPERDGQLYTPQRWVELGLISAWWPLVRPLLAKLNWISPLYGGTGFRAADLRDVQPYVRLTEETG